MAVPIRAIHIRNNNPTVRKIIDKLAVANVNTDVVDLPRGAYAEHNQIPRLKLISRHIASHLRLRSRSPRNMNPIKLEDILGIRRTIQNQAALIAHSELISYFAQKRLGRIDYIVANTAVCYCRIRILL